MVSNIVSETLFIKNNEVNYNLKSYFNRRDK